MLHKCIVVETEEWFVAVVRILQPSMPEYRRAFYEKLVQLGAGDGVIYLPSASRAPLDARGRGDEIATAEFFTFVDSKEFVLGNRSLVWHVLNMDWMKADLIIAEHAIRNLVAFKWCYFRRPKRLAFWGHGRTYTKVKTGIEESLKMRLLRRADWYFAYTQGGASAVTATGFPKRRVTVVQNSTDTSLLQELRAEITVRDIDALRQQLGIQGVKVAIFIGGLDESKRLEFIVEAAAEVARVHPDFRAVFFGAGSQQDYIENQAAENDFIVYGGRADAHIQAVVSQFASFILMPGRVGLVAVDSFALELPIVTTDWPLHAPEFEYLVDEYNAIVTPDSLDAYVTAILDLLGDSGRLELLKANCAKSAQEYSIENMARNFHQGVLEALALPSREK